MPNTAVDDPWQIYSRLFSTVGMTDAQLARTMSERQSVLDFLKDDLTKLRLNGFEADRWICRALELFVDDRIWAHVHAEQAALSSPS